MAVALLDYSASLSDEEFDKYVHMLNRGLMKNLTFDDEIVLIPIDQASVMKNEIIGSCNFSDLREPLSGNIPQFAILSEEDTIRHRFEAVLDTLFQSKIYSFRDSRRKYNILTDIVGSINQAFVYLNRTEKTRRALFIFSDMIQESEDLNLKKIRNLSGIEKAVDKLEESGSIPELGGAKVFICGATEKKARRYQLNQKFWYLFFQKAHASIYDYGYGNSDRINGFLRELRKGG